MTRTRIGTGLRRGMLALGCALVASVPALADKKKPPAAPPPPLSFEAGRPLSLMYVWDATIPGDARATAELLSFARRVLVNTLAIEASPVGYGVPGARERYAEFTAAARREGFLVFALGGYPWYTVAPDAGVPGQPTSWLEGWDVYGRIARSALFDAVLDDSSPAETNYVAADGTLVNRFWEDPERAAQDYLDYLAGLERELGSFPHVQAVPCWFDSDRRLKELRLDGEPEAHSLAWYVARRADALNVLAYRDSARQIVFDVAGELALGRVLIGVETMDLGPELARTTFFEEGVRGLLLELNAVWLSLRGHPGLAGFSVHHYGSYRELLRRDRPSGAH